MSDQGDLFRDTPLRLLGYANEVGESFRQIVGPRIVTGTYGIAFAYCCGDTWHKATRPGLTKTQAWQAGTDAFVWQLFASVIIPGFVINRVVALVSHSMETVPKIGRYPWIRRWGPVGCGLIAIPFIVEPIDSLVHFGMDKLMPTRNE